MSLIAQNLTTMINSEDRGPLQSKRKAITTLLPYAIRRERDGQPDMLDIFLRAARASNEWAFTWHQFRGYADGLLREASPRAVVLVLPFISWDWLTYQEDWIQRWAWAVSAAPDTERVAQSVVDTLLQIASKEKLLPYIPVNIWSWLTKQPRLPAICLGRNVGTSAHVVKAVRALKDIEILKSYFLLVWSEWNHFSPDGSNGLDRPPPPVSPPTQLPVYVYPVHVAHGALSHDTSASSDSIPDHPPSHILDSPSSRHSSSISNRNPTSRTLNSLNSVSVRPRPPNNTQSHHSTHIANSVLSRRMSISSNSTPSSPPVHIIPIDTPIRYSLPIPIGNPILQSPILQPPILDLPSIPISIPTRRSSNSSNNTLNHHMPNGSNSVSNHHPPPPDSAPGCHSTYVADSMSSRHTSISSNGTPGPPLHPISIQIPQPFMQPPLVDQPPPASQPSNVVTPSTPSVRMLNIQDGTCIQIVPTCVQPGLAPSFQDSKWIDQALMPSPPIGPPRMQIYYAVQSCPVAPSNRMLNIQNSRSDLRPPHTPNNMPSSYFSGGFYEMQISIQEDFGGAGMEHHRADLLKRLDHVIRRLDRGLEYFKQHDPAFNEAYLQRTKHQYQYLREILLEIDIGSD